MKCLNRLFLMAICCLLSVVLIGCATVKEMGKGFIGVSCFIDQKGRIVDGVGSGSGATFVDGFKMREITLTRARTFYTLHGDIFAYLCLLAAIGYLLEAKGKRWLI